VVVRDALALDGQERARTTYVDGVSRSIPTLEALADFLLDLRAGLGQIRRTYCLGTSSGAYAAIILGARLAADAVWAFSPSHLERGPRLADAIAAAAGTAFHVWYGEQNPTDRRVAESLAGCSGTTLHGVATASHLVVRAMWDAGCLPELLPRAGRVAPRPTRTALRALSFASEVEIGPARVHELLRSVAPDLPASPAAPTALRGVVAPAALDRLVDLIAHDLRLDRARLRVEDDDLSSVDAIVACFRRALDERARVEGPGV
jgi:hypothetical protein